jgi:hypothetical protein
MVITPNNGELKCERVGDKLICAVTKGNNYCIMTIDLSNNKVTKQYNDKKLCMLVEEEAAKLLKVRLNTPFVETKPTQPNKD